MPRFLIVLWALLLGSSFLQGIPSSGALLGKFATPAVLRVASSLVLVIGAWWQMATRRERVTARFGLAMAVTVGMTLGALGDALSLVSEAWLPAPRLVLAMGLFGLGHVAYIRGLLGALGGRPARCIVSLSTFFWLAVVVLAWQETANASIPPSPLRWPALGYSLLLGSTAIVSSVLAWQKRRFLPVAAGAALFFVSDVVLAYEAFRGGFPGSTDLCWATYGPGQMLIVAGSLAASGLTIPTSGEAESP